MECAQLAAASDPITRRPLDLRPRPSNFLPSTSPILMGLSTDPLFRACRLTHHPMKLRLKQRSGRMYTDTRGWYTPFIVPETSAVSHSRKGSADLLRSVAAAR